MPVIRTSIVTAIALFVGLAACGEVTSTPIDAGSIDTSMEIDGAPIDTPTDSPSNQTLTVVLAGTSAGRVTSSPAGIDCGASCTMTAAAGTTITLTAAPDPGATFAGWSGACTGTTTTCVVSLSAATTVTATFNVARYTVTVNLMGNGAGTVTSTPAGITCPGTCTMTVDHGATLNLAAAPDGSSTFVGWGGSCVGTGACALTVTSDTTVNAAFALNSSLVVTRAGNGTGTVTSAPAGINCGADCSEAYTPGTIVTLTATPAAGSAFIGWAGGGCTGTGVCTITLNAAQMVTATFTLNQYTLTVARAGTGTGTVSSTPSGINCGSDCTEVVNHGTMVTLTATAVANSTFAGWSGGGCTGTGICVTTVTAATTVTATFNIMQVTLTVAKTGAGTGTVTSSPVGINCGTDCTEPYNLGSTVVLSVTPAAGSSFAGWSGGGCSGTAATCTVSMAAATTVTASFDLTGVTVTASWNCASGVSCTDLYDFTFAADTNVTFQVTSVTGASVLRLGAYAPGVPYSGASLLTGIAADRACVGQNTNDSVVFKAVNAGTYRLAVGRDWGSSAGASGTYILSVSASRPMTYVGTSNNDVPEGTTAMRCGYIATFSSNWACSSGVSCQDTYSFDTLAGTTTTVAATAVTGASVVRLAVFNGTAVTTTNQLNGMLTDRKCAAQNANDTATSVALPVGGHLFSIGRDWGSSAGASGTYTYTITTPNVPLVPRGQVTNDTGSAFATTTCP